MADITLSPSSSIKLRNKEYANKMRHGSPKLQEVIRQRCRDKMKERRNQFFNRNRFGLQIASSCVQDTFTEIVRQEIDNLTTADVVVDKDLIDIFDGPLDPDEALELEAIIIAEEEQWICQEYERILQDEMKWLTSLDDQEIQKLECPICQKSILVERFDYVSCESCGLKLTMCNSLQRLAKLLNESINSHSVDCNMIPNFSVVSENNNCSLYMTCDACSLLSCII